MQWCQSQCLSVWKREDTIVECKSCYLEVKGHMGQCQIRVPNKGRLALDDVKLLHQRTIPSMPLGLEFTVFPDFRNTEKLWRKPKSWSRVSDRKPRDCLVEGHPTAVRNWPVNHGISDFYVLDSLFSVVCKCYFVITSRVSGRGYRIGAVFLCVCVSVSTLTAEPFDLRPWFLVSQTITQRTFGQKDWTIWEMREVRERSGVFIQY